jgi:AcrR family transcriptional regulator
VSSKTLYRLVPNKAALFEAMVTDRLERFVSAGPIGADMTTTMSRHMIIAEGDRFPEIAETFFKKSCYGERRPHRRLG